MRLAGDPAAPLAAALVHDPDFLPAQVLIAQLAVLSTGAPAAAPAVAGPLATMRAMIDRGLGDDRMRAHAVVAEAWAAGRLRYAASVLETLVGVYPHDVLSLRLLHDTYIALGDVRNLRDACVRVLPAWDASQPGFARVAGMAAYGFQEAGQFERAEELAMQSLGADPGDTWALHAAVHVFDATCRGNEGERLLRETREHWEDATGLAHHIQWHWGLLQLEAGRVAEATLRYDDQLGRARTTVASAADDAAFLWRLELVRRPLLGPPLSGRRLPPSPSEPMDQRYLALTAGRGGGGGGGDGDDGAGASASAPPPSESEAPVTRWSELARRIRPFVGGHVTPFNDVHVALALVAAGDGAALAAHLAGMAALAERCVADVKAVAVAADVAALPGRLPAALRQAEHAYCRPPLPLPPVLSVERSGVDEVGLSPIERQLLASADGGVGGALAGLDVAHGCVAFWRGDWDRATELLLRSRPHWAALGGSQSQRDVFELTLTHAAAEAGRWGVARGLLAERVGHRFASPSAWFMLGSALTAEGDAPRGADARNRAYMLGLGSGGPSH